MSLPPGPGAPSLLQTLDFMLRPEASLHEATERWGHVYTRRNSGWGAHVVISDPELIKQVFTGDPSVFHAGEVNASASFLLGCSIFLIDGAEHLARRRLMMPPF